MDLLQLWNNDNVFWITVAVIVVTIFIWQTYSASPKRVSAQPQEHDVLNEEKSKKIKQQGSKKAKVKSTSHHLTFATTSCRRHRTTLTRSWSTLYFWAA